MRRLLSLTLLALAGGLLPSSLTAQTTAAPRTVELTALTDDILVLRVDEGFVIHHGQGQQASQDRVFVEPLDGAAAQAATYTITSADDPAYATPRTATGVDRKSKPTDFASFCDRFGPDPNPRFANSCFNDQIDQATEHLLYLRLPSPLVDGRTYTVTPDAAAVPGVAAQTITYDDRISRSEAVHVNQVGYVPDASEKFGYVYHWMGDGGGLSVDALPGGGSAAPRGFALVDEATGAAAFAGVIAFRKPANNQETGQPGQAPPNGNLLQAPVWECDFSAFRQNGTYRLCVDGVGCSFAFEIAHDVYLEPFAALVEGVYQQRSGIATVAPYTSQPRPAPHRVGVTPGFAGRLKYSTVRAIDYTNFNSPGSQKADIDAAILGPLESWGWYQDAGDWDSYYSHTNVPARLLWLYEMHAAKFGDGQLLLPEAGNGLPDVLDEALWNVRWQQRLRAELVAKGYGTGGVGGGRVFGDLWGEDRAPDGGLRGSCQDNTRDWIVSGEDAMVTYKYAGLAAHVAVLLAANRLTDPAGVDWAAEATSAYAWAQANTRSGDEAKRSDDIPFYHARFFAAANLYRLTGVKAYETQASADFDRLVPDNPTTERHFGMAAYRAAADERPGSDPAVVTKVTNKLVSDGRFSLETYRNRRAARWGGNWFFPIVIGQPTTPMIEPGIIAHYFAPAHDPGFVAQYERALYSTADYFLGNNPLNLTWISGVGDRSPAEIFALDAWVLGGETPRRGIIPYGPTAQQFNFFRVNGPFNFAWPLQYIYPADEKVWPVHELWFDQRPAPTTAEYTVHQNLAAGFFTYGYLYALAAPDFAPLPVTWVSAEARRGGPGQVDVTWSVAGVAGNDRYEVERRTGAEDWRLVGTVPDAARASYSFTDASAPTAVTYYRIRQVDTDGASSYSPVLVVPSVAGVSARSATPAWSIAPTAARDVLRVAGAPAGEVEVFDAVGRRVGRFADGTTQLPVDELAPGVYYVRIGGVARAFTRVE